MNTTPTTPAIVASWEIDTTKSAADIEQLQMMDWGLRHRVPDVTIYSDGDDVTLTTSDGEVFAGCSIYGIDRDASVIEIAVS